MDLSAQLVEYFDEFGIVVADNILEKCIELCHKHNVNAERFGDSWMSYATTKLDGVVEPTVALLREMEKEAFRSNKGNITVTPLPVKFEHQEHREVNLQMDHDDVIEQYIGHQTKTPNNVRRQVPTTPGTAKLSLAFDDEDIAQNKSNEKVILTFGRHNPLASTASKNNADKIQITEIPLNAEQQLIGCTQQYIYDLFSEKCDFEERCLLTIGEQIRNKINSNLASSQLPATPQSEGSIETNSQQLEISNREVSLSGRIGFHNQAKPSERNGYLVTDFYGQLKRIALNFSKAPAFSIFPGQVVVVRGTNTKSELYPFEICTETEQTLPSPSKGITFPISLVVASGPFTSNENLDYEPLKTLLRSIATNPPDVLLLVGPILDADNKLIVEGELDEDISVIVNKIMTLIYTIVDNRTHVIVTSSPRDIRSKVYPTFAYPKVDRTHYIPDPSLISLNGFTVGVTSVDCLSHLLETELVRSSHEDKIRRSVNYLFNQKTFYPLRPTNTDVNIDSSLAAKFLNLLEIPNMMILPGKLNGFVRDIKNCLVINPGHLANFTEGGGTYCKMIINPVTNDGAKLFDYISCQIIRI